jgi:hypothetical protein
MFGRLFFVLVFFTIIIPRAGSRMRRRWGGFLGLKCMIQVVGSMFRFLSVAVGAGGGGGGNDGWNNLDIDVGLAYGIVNFAINGLD